MGVAICCLVGFYMFIAGFVAWLFDLGVLRGWLGFVFVWVGVTQFLLLLGWFAHLLWVVFWWCVFCGLGCGLWVVYCVGFVLLLVCGWVFLTGLLFVVS